MRTVGAIGDIHAESFRLSAALAFLAARGVEQVLAVGDIVDGPGDALRCCQLLEAHRAEAVLGNHDRWFLKDATQRSSDPLCELLAALPATRSYETEAGMLLLCHGLGENDMNRLRPDDFSYALEVNDELQELLATRDSLSSSSTTEG